MIEKHLDIVAEYIDKYKLELSQENTSIVFDEESELVGEYWGAPAYRKNIDICMDVRFENTRFYIVFDDKKIEFYHEESLKDYNCESQELRNSSEIKEELLIFWEAIENNLSDEEYSHDEEIYLCDFLKDIE